MTPHARRLLAAPVAALAFVAALAQAPPAAAAAAPPGTTWRETFIGTPDGQSLHVDVIHPEALPEEAGPRPVILVVSPYLGIAPDAAARPGRPLQRLLPGRLRRRGDLRARLLGGAGQPPRHRAVPAAAWTSSGPASRPTSPPRSQWVDHRPWADGRSAMYGKSYDANTGVVGAALRPPGLDAIIAQQITPDRYRGSYNDRVRFLQSLALPVGLLRLRRRGRRSRCNSEPAVRSPTASPTAPTARFRSPTTTSRTRHARSGGSATSWSAPRAAPFRPSSRPATSTSTPTSAAERSTSSTPWPAPSACGSAGGTTSAATTWPAGARHGPRGLLRRGHALLRLLPAGVPIDQLADAARP